MNIIYSHTNSSYGINNIPTKIFKSAAIELSYPLYMFMNKTFMIGIFPDILKMACITPLHKSGSLDDVGNYRPITALPLLSKMLKNLSM